MKKITIKDVAREAGVSIALVSRVLNAPLREDGLPDCQVRDVTAKRILNTVRYLGYHPNRAAVSLRKTLRKRLGVILPDIANPFYANIARHFEEIAHAHDYIVLFGSSNERADRLLEMADTFIQDGVDGIVLTPGQDCRETVQRVVAEGIPVVLAIRNIEDLPDTGRVLTDNRQGTELALGHLLRAGYRRIEMISTSLRYSNIVERERLFLEKMQEEGLATRILHVLQENREESLHYILEDTMRRGTEALYCPNASLPAQCLGECKKMGISVPEDLALLGYDGGAIFHLTNPSITQVRYNPEDIARETFNVFLEMMEDRSHIPPFRILKPTLEPGDSTPGPYRRRP